MVDKNTNEESLPVDPEIPEGLTDEVAAAVEELKDAQAKLDTATAETPKGSVAEGGRAESAASQEVPIILDAEPVAASTDKGQNWVPYGAPGQAYQPQQGTPPPYQDNPAAQQPYYQQTQQPYYTPYPNTPPQPDAQTPPQQPYYYQQGPARPVVSSKDHVAAGLLGIFLGYLGIHKFYLGYNTAGFIMLAVTILGSIITIGLAAAVMALIGFIEGIIYLVKSQSEFEYLYVFNKREWF